MDIGVVVLVGFGGLDDEVALCSYIFSSGVSDWLVGKVREVIV